MPRPRLTGAVLAAALLVIGCGSSSPSKGASSSSTSAGSASTASSASSTASSSSGTTIALTVSGGHVEGGVQTKNVALGASVTITVTSDAGDEVHVHGYDQKVEVTAGRPASVTFTADIPGQFEVELENAHLKIVELEVS